MSSPQNSNERRIGFSSTRSSHRRAGSRGGQRSFLERSNDQLREMVADHEGQSVLAALALGFGIGLALGLSIAPEPKQRWTDRIAAEGLGRRLLERIDSLLPESISDKLST